MLRGILHNFKIDISSHFLRERAKPFLMTLAAVIIAMAAYCLREYLDIFLDVRFFVNVSNFECYCYAAIAGVLLLMPFCLNSELFLQVQNMSKIFLYSEQRRGYITAARYISNTVFAVLAFSIGAAAGIVQNILLYESVNMLVSIKTWAGSIVLLCICVNAFNFLSSLNIGKKNIVLLSYFFFTVLCLLSIIGGQSLIDTIHFNNIIYLAAGAVLTITFMICGYLYLRYSKAGKRII